MNKGWRQTREHLFLFLCRSVTFCAVAVLGILLFHILNEGLSWLNMNFLNSFPSRFTHKAGVKSALFGSLWLISMTTLFVVPLGVATAFYLEEYAPRKRLIRWIEINISNLAGMPSIVYGLLGLTIFVRFFDLDRSLLAGALTLSLLVLPVIIISSQEAIRAVPNAIRDAAYALGARRWQVIIGQILPAALPGIMTGLILAISRAIGESAPMIMVGALAYVAFVPESPSDPFTVLPIQIFNWAGRPQADFHGLAGAGIIVLLILLFTMNLLAVLIRQRAQKYKM